MDYESVSLFAQTWGLVFLVVMFSVAVVYALWPRNRDKFQRAAHLPLTEGDDFPQSSEKHLESRSCAPGKAQDKLERKEVERG